MTIRVNSTTCIVCQDRYAGEGFVAVGVDDRWHLIYENSVLDMFISSESKKGLKYAWLVFFGFDRFCLVVEFYRRGSATNRANTSSFTESCYQQSSNTNYWGSHIWVFRLVWNGVLPYLVISEIRNSEIQNDEHIQSTLLGRLVYATLNPSMCAGRSTNTKKIRNKWAKVSKEKVLYFYVFF